MVAFTSQISVLLLLLLYATTFERSMSNNHRVVRCKEKDRGTLLIFKQGVVDPSNRLSTWSKEADCCAWRGVECDNITGRVTRLDLKLGHLKGELNLSLLELEFLNYLDLSWNDFEAVSIPPIRGNITLAISLYYLDLSHNFMLHMDNLHWLSRLSSLKYLNLSFIDLRKQTNGLQLVAMPHSLSELRLAGCQLTNNNPSVEYVNSTSLVTLDLSYNNFNSELPHWLFNLSSEISYLDLGSCSLHGEIHSSMINLRNLEYLDISHNQLEGSNLDWLSQQKHLKHLDLSHNQFRGSIPYWLGQREHLQHLDLSYNLFSGSIPSNLGNLSSLVYLSSGANSFSGALFETNFSKLSNLKYLDLSNSDFAFLFDPEWTPPFQLSALNLANTSQGPDFPSWIYTQKSLEFLDISSSGISFVDGDIFWSFVAGIEYLNLSSNFINGDISNVTLNSYNLMLDHNNFTGGLPHLSANVSLIDLSHNSFSGSIPDGWESGRYLYQINLKNNMLSGEVTLDLSNFKGLELLDLGENEFSGTIPIKLPRSLRVMILRSNQFAGNIPQQLCNLQLLVHLDLAKNKFSGSIPQCMYNMTTMVTNNVSDSYFYNGWKFDLFTKGQEYEYEYKGVSRTIDLSSNNLSGEIPLELFKLVEVQNLNLSHNRLTGTIPKMIGSMKNLESLDLSSNRLFGEIPQRMTGLTFLGYMNLSYNNFSGQIPLGTQLQSFDASSYIENPELCGLPLKNCTEEENHEKAKQYAGNEDDDAERKSLYLGMGIGFAVSFWGICGSLFLNRTWRHTYFRFLDRVVDHLYVTLMVKFNNFRKI